MPDKKRGVYSQKQGLDINLQDTLWTILQMLISVTRPYQDPKAFCLLRLLFNPVPVLHLVTKKKHWLHSSCSGALMCQGRQEADIVPGEPTNIPDTGTTAWWMQISCTFDIWKLKVYELKQARKACIISLWELLDLSETCPRAVQNIKLSHVDMFYPSQTRVTKCVERPLGINQDKYSNIFLIESRL